MRTKEMFQEQKDKDYHDAHEEIEREKEEILDQKVNKIISDDDLTPEQKQLQTRNRIIKAVHRITMLDDMKTKLQANRL